MGVSVRYLILAALFISVYLVAEETYKVDIDSKGIKTFYNKKPADPDFKIELKKIGEISPDYIDSLDLDMSGKNNISVYDFDFDKDGNIIILDHNRMWKFSRTGQFIKKWSRRGHGPGEITNPRSFYILNDTIHVVDSPKIKKFDIDGNFICDINVVNYTDFPSNIFAVCEDYLLGKKVGFDVDTKMKTDKIMMYEHKELKVIKTLFERKYKKKGSMFSRDDYFLYAGDETEFFIVNNSYDEYKIDCFDSKSGKLKYKIRKNHIRVKNDEEEKTHRGVYEGKEIIVTTGGEKLKESINWIFYDRHGRLWVDSNNIHEEEPGLYFDIFKDGVFLNRVKLDLPFDNPWGFNLNGNRILIFDEDYNVYFYEFK